MKKIISLSFFSIIMMLFAIIPGKAWSYDKVPVSSARDCLFCHHDTEITTGPHGNYTSKTNKCSTCHPTHGAQHPSLLPANSITGVCQYCHDLTQSNYAPYNFKDDGSDVPTVYSAHRVAGLPLPNEYINEMGELVTTEPMLQGLSGNIIPGGSEYDGGTGAFNGQNQGGVSGVKFSCSSCHSVHGLGVVEPYLGESPSKVRVSLVSDTFETKIYLTSRLLRIKPNNVDEPVYRYGPQWCLSCHKGRGNSLIMNKFNHHVNEIVFADLLDFLSESSFIYPGGKLAALNDIRSKGYVVLANGNSNDAHIIGDPRNNSLYTMSPWDSIDRTFREDGSVPYETPICQQCHGNPRDVEKAFYLGPGPDNPSRFSFPHVSPNKALLVEKGVDLCTNCHEADSLP